MTINPQRFDHEKLDVYRTAIEFMVLVNHLTEHSPKGYAYLADQLRRAGSSISLNIAEGAGEFSKNEKLRFYRMAKRSATECAGIFDIYQRLHLVQEIDYMNARDLLIRIVSMLINMVK